MVFLRLTVKVPPPEPLHGPNRAGSSSHEKPTNFLMVIRNPEQVNLGELCWMIAEKWVKLRPDTEPLRIKKLLDDEHDENDLDADLTVSDVFVDNGKAVADGHDQRAAVRVIQDPSTSSRIRYGSVVQDWGAMSGLYTQRNSNDSQAQLPIITNGGEDPLPGRHRGESLEHDDPVVKYSSSPTHHLLAHVESPRRVSNPFLQDPDPFQSQDLTSQTLNHRHAIGSIPLIDRLSPSVGIPSMSNGLRRSKRQRSSSPNHSLTRAPEDQDGEDIVPPPPKRRNTHARASQSKQDRASSRSSAAGDSIVSANGGIPIANDSPLEQHYSQYSRPDATEEGQSTERTIPESPLKDAYVAPPPISTYEHDPDQAIVQSSFPPPPDRATPMELDNTDTAPESPMEVDTTPTPSSPKRRTSNIAAEPVESEHTDAQREVSVANEDTSDSDSASSQASYASVDARKTTPVQKDKNNTAPESSHEDSEPEAKSTATRNDSPKKAEDPEFLDLSQSRNSSSPSHEGPGPGQMGSGIPRSPHKPKRKAPPANSVAQPSPPASKRKAQDHHSVSPTPRKKKRTDRPSRDASESEEDESISESQSESGSESKCSSSAASKDKAGVEKNSHDGQSASEAESENESEPPSPPHSKDGPEKNDSQNREPASDADSGSGSDSEDESEEESQSDRSSPFQETAETTTSERLPSQPPKSQPPQREKDSGEIATDPQAADEESQESDSDSGEEDESADEDKDKEPTKPDTKSTDSQPTETKPTTTQANDSESSNSSDSSDSSDESDSSEETQLPRSQPLPKKQGPPDTNLRRPGTGLGGAKNRKQARDNPQVQNPKSANGTTRSSPLPSSDGYRGPATASQPASLPSRNGPGSTVNGNRNASKPPEQRENLKSLMSSMSRDAKKDSPSASGEKGSFFGVGLLRRLGGSN